MKKITVKLTNGDVVNLIGEVANVAQTYTVAESSGSVFSIMPNNILWVQMRDYVEEMKDGNVHYVDFNKETNQ